MTILISLYRWTIKKGFLLMLIMVSLKNLVSNMVSIKLLALMKKILIFGFGFFNFINFYV